MVTLVRKSLFSEGRMHSFVFLIRTTLLLLVLVLIIPEFVATEAQSPKSRVIVGALVVDGTGR